MRFIDMFSGIGTVRMGFEQAGHECVYSIEWDKHKRRIYGIIFGEEPQGSDISTVRADELPHADCWTFGAPCQDFSIAGKRSGLEGDRSSLIREVFRLVRETKEEYRPEWLLYENVKGMLSSNKGLDYLEILNEMAALGYDIEYELLNSKDFGVPQNRERVFTLGHIRNRGRREIFPIRRNESKDIIKELEIPKEVLNDNERQRRVYNTNGISPSILGRNDSPKIVIKKIGSVNNSQSGAIYDPNGLATTINSHGGGQGAKTGLYMVKTIGQVSTEGSQAGKVYDANGIFPTICAGTHGYANGNIEVKACLTPNRLEKRQNGRRFKEDGEPMFTLTKQDIHGVAILRPVRNEYGKAIRKQYEAGGIQESRHQMTSLQPRQDGISNTITTVQKDNLLQTECRIRRLTPKECWRLQGIDDTTTDKVIAAGISDTQMYRGAGDACSVPVIYEIARRLK